jgi:hypothetical protein
MRSIIDFKTERVNKEWRDDRVSEKLKKVVILLAYYSWNFFGKRLALTEIFRTPEEQNKYYGKNEKYKKKPWLSTHQFWRAADLRTAYFDDIEIKTLLKIANSIVYDQNRPRKKTAIFHDIGQGRHIHVQVMQDQKG